MRRAILAVVALCSCSDPIPQRPCEREHEAVDSANAAFRRATGWYTNSVERDTCCNEQELAWEAVNKAATQQATARSALSRCLGTEAT